ncbi:NAD(P)H-quinone oxidoreductase [Phanerochaete sordida]|uniref:NAD(P)H-quinone oxidoreductase n=1 Tax=Phanerochaete sordida TaxID=48140 RepID=A0A9P3GDP4_9APHY|nr:NAD(P)H-quinone oxidoreductase [Phanerochaete sordida]
MRAVIVKDGKGPVENLYIGEIERPAPRRGEVLVQIKAFGLNRMDIMQREGGYPLPPGAPDTLGVEFSGTVAELGDGSAKFKVGDEVIGLALGGAYAEYIRLPETNVVPKPAHLTWEEAASIPENFLTAYQALIVIAQCKKGDDVLIHAGASGVGIAAIQLARLFGANTVTATTSTQAKIDFLLQMPHGATHAVNYKTQDFFAETQKITNGKGVDVIIDFVGRTHWHQNIAAFAKDGRMTLLATLSGGKVPEVDLGPILYKRLHIEGSTLRSRSAAYQADLIARFEEQILGEITGSTGEGKIRTYIHEVFPFERIQDAHRTMQADANAGKLIVTIP